MAEYHEPARGYLRKKSNYYRILFQYLYLFFGTALFEKLNPDMAIDIIHNILFGNLAAILTQSRKRAREFQYKTECGNIGINIGIAAPTAFFSFDGMKDFFFVNLHLQGQEAILFLCRK